MTYQTALHLFAFLGLDLPQVEFKLLAFQDVAIRPAALARSGGDASCKRDKASVKRLADMHSMVSTNLYDYTTMYASMLKEIVYGKTAQDRNTGKSVNSNTEKKLKAILEILSLLVTDIVSKVAELHAWLVKTLRPYLPTNILIIKLFLGKSKIIFNVELYVL